MKPDAVKREAWWVAAAGAVTITTAALHGAYGAWVWPVVAAGLYLIRPALRLWTWTAPRRAGVIPPARGPRRAVERVSPRLKASGFAKRLHDDWPNVCREAQWTRGDVHPSLVYCRAEGTETIAVGWRPWINQGEKSWDALAHVVRRAVDGQTVRWWINSADSGILEVRIGLKPLPAKITLTHPPRPAATDGTGRFWLGPRAGGGDASWCPLESPHMLITGSTNYGKGGTLRVLLAQARDWRVHVVNPKRSGEFGWLRSFPSAQVVSSRVDAARMLVDLDRYRETVQQIIEARSLDRWTDIPAAERPTPHLVVIDEASELLDGDDDDTVACADALVSLARMGRSAGIHLVVATQRPDVAGGGMGRRGGQLRAQLTARLVVGKIDKAGLGMVLEGRDTDVLAGLPGMPGRALATGLDAGAGSDVYVVQVAWLPQDAAGGAPLAAGAAGVVSELAEADTTTPVGGGVVAGSDNRSPALDVTGGSGGDASPGGDAEGPRGVGADISDPAPADGRVPTTGPVDPEDTAVDVVSGDSSGGPEVVPLAVAAERLGVSERTVRRWASDPRKPHIRDAGWGRFALD